MPFFMQTISVYSAQAALAGLKEQKIAEGSLVNVRIISSNGEGKYTGIVAGARVNLKSDSVLQNGDVFKAKISIKDNTIFLKPVQNNSIENNHNIQLDNFPLKLVENEQIFNFFSRLGLPADNAMLNIFQMMKQLKMKMDIPLFLKFHNLSVKFGEKQKSTSEILMILQKKGIEISIDTLMDLVGYVEGKEFWENSEEKKSREDSQKRILNLLNGKPGGWFVFPFCIMESGLSEVDVVTAGVNSVNGVSSIADRIGDGIGDSVTKSTDLKKKLEYEKKIGEGNIRVLVNDSKKLEILNFSCFYKNSGNFASFLYDNGFVKTLRVNFQNKLEKKDDVILYLKSKLEKLYNLGKTKNKIEVQWASEDELSGFSCDNEKFYSINKRI